MVISNFAFLGRDRAEKANSNLTMKFDRHQFGAKLHWKQNQDDLYMRGADNNLLIDCRVVLELFVSPHVTYEKKKLAKQQ